MISANLITGAILAGGSSSRMGTDKALLVLDGLTLIEHVSKTMREVFEEVIVITNVPMKYRFLNIPTYPDIYRGCGPLGGIHSAFVHSRAPSVFVVACDAPFVTKDLIYHIINTISQGSVRVPISQGKVHPLCGYYSRECLQEIQQRLEQRQLKVLDLLKQINARTIEITPDLQFYKKDLLLNLNEPKDFASLGDRSVFSSASTRTALK